MNQFSDHYQSAIAQIDLANSQDPNTTLVGEETFPKELIYSKRMTSCLEELKPAASEELHLAARAHHICRWEIPRKDFPMGKVGYHQWRNTLKKFHANKVGAILNQIGYNEALIERVQFLIQKKKLKQDEETQTLEDVICLVFLEYYIADFAKGKEESKLIDIVQKTWKKMSSQGQAAALKIDYAEAVKALIFKALR